MDDRLKPLMQRLGDAINESLSNSESIAEVIREIKETGHDVFLVLEATIGFNKRDPTSEAEEERPKTNLKTNLKFNQQDLELLRAMHIAPNDNGEKPKQLPPPKNPPKKTS